MESIRIIGGQPLTGQISIQGSKNAALPMMAAALLHDGVVTLTNCPKITDVLDMVHILESIGVKTVWVNDALIIDSRNICSTIIPKEYANKMRSSIVLMASILARMKEVKMPHPGGCVIGKRPIDLHRFVLHEMGADVIEDSEYLIAQIDNFKGNHVNFKKKSVGATEHAVMAAVLAEGKTVIENAASEPEVVALCNMLNKMGANIKWGKHMTELQIKGVEKLHAVTMQVPPDRIVAGTYLLASAITRSTISLLNPPLEELKCLLKIYNKMGGQYEVIGGKLFLDSRGVSKPIEFVETKEYPGFPTDLQSILMSVLATIPGKSVIKENIFEDRFHTADGLTLMGAKIAISEDKKVATIQGIEKLRGATVEATDLRGGAALVLAGLAAEGITIVNNYHFIERGYEAIDDDLNKLGGDLLVNKGENNENKGEEQRS